MFREIGQEYGHVETDVLRWIVEPIGELQEVDLSVLVGIDAHHDVFYLLSKRRGKQQQLVSELT